MKYGIVISVSKTKFGPIVFKENLAENIVKAASMGYDGVELAIRNPEALKIPEVDKLIKRYKIEVLAIGTGQIYGEEGLSFSDSNKDIRRDAVERTKKIIDIAAHFRASIIIGLVRGNISNMENYASDLEKAERNIADCLEVLLSYSEEKSVGFLLEPINRYEVNIFNQLKDISNFLSKYTHRLDPKRIGILADTFHMNIEEPVIEDSLKKYSNLIRHIHFADSNRWPPGYGHIDFKSIMKTLKSAGYNDYISFEMLPMPDPETAAREGINCIKSL